jgi:DNA repair protein RAD16
MQNGRCQDCGCSSIQHFSHFNKYVLNPIQRAGYQGDGRRAMMKLKTEVLDKSLIRRTKETKSEDMKLPPRIVEIKPIRLHPREEDFYSSLYTETKNSFDDYIQEGTLLNNYAHIFDLLTKMRQAVDHPYLIVYSKKNAGRLQQQNSPAVANGSIDCDICGEPPTDRVVSSCCGGAFCRSCVIDYMSSSLENARHDSTRCPSCREPFTIDLSQATSDVVDDGVLTISETQGTGSPTEAMPSLREMTHVSSGSILRRINLAEYATSTKIEALVQELVQMRQERPGSKALVFSQVTSLLSYAIL